MRNDNDHALQRKIEAILQDEFPLENLAADPDLPAIIHEMCARQRALERQNETLRRSSQELIPTPTNDKEPQQKQSRLERLVVQRTANLQEEILQHEQTELTLRENETRLRQIIEQMPYPVEVCRPDGTATLVNQAFLDMFGIPSKALVIDKYNVFDDSLVMEQLGLADDIQNVYSGQRVFISELEIPLEHTEKNYSGQRTAAIVCEVTMFPVFKRSGEIWRVVTIWKEITERKQAEQQLRQSNQELAHRAEELAALNLITQTVSTVTDLSTMLETVARLVTELLDGAGTIVSLLDETRTQLNVVAHASRRPGAFDLTGATFPVVDAIQRTVVEQRKAMIIPDVQHNPLAAPAHDLFRRRNIHCLINLPLLARDEVIGIIAVSSDQPDRCFTPDDVRLAETVAGQIAGAIEMARLFGKERRSRRIAESLREVSAALTSSLELETVLETIFDQIGQIIQCDGGGVFLQEGDDLVLTAGIGFAAKNHIGERIPLSSQNPSVRPFRDKRRHLIADGTAELHWMDWPEGDTIYSWIGAPLLIGQQCIGVLTVDSYKPHTFDPEEAETLQIFANQAAVAIHNAQLHQQVRQDAATKATMLQEIHHRVKNNFQIVSSLLNFQANYVQDEQAKSVLRNSQRRVHSMALLHNHLYRSPDLASIDFANYVKQLSDSLLVAYHTTLSRPIDIDLDIENIYFSIEVALPCGLIVNELVSNALKHAFPVGRATGEAVTISLHADGSSYTLTVADNGIGLPAGTDPRGEESLGIFLVQAFVDQLDGSLQWEPNVPTGARFTVTFPGDG